MVAREFWAVRWFKSKEYTLSNSLTLSGFLVICISPSVSSDNVCTVYTESGQQCLQVIQRKIDLSGIR